MTETWLKSGDAVTRAELKPDGYNFKDYPIQSRMNGGGIGIMYKNGIKYKVRSSGEMISFEHSKYDLLHEKTKLDIHVIISTSIFHNTSSHHCKFHR